MVTVESLNNSLGSVLNLSRFINFPPDWSCHHYNELRLGEIKRRALCGHWLKRQQCCIEIEQQDQRNYWTTNTQQQQLREKLDFGLFPELRNTLKTQNDILRHVYMCKTETLSTK